MKGTVEGSTTVLKTIHSEAPKLLAAVRRFMGVVFTPSRVLINIGKTAPRKIMPIFESIPIPNQIITKGNRATGGVASMALTKGSKLKLILLSRPAEWQ